MITIQQVEELRKYADISFNEAKVALEETEGDLLQAIINLEKRGRINGPKDGGFYSSQTSEENNQSSSVNNGPKTEFYEESGTTFSELIGKFTAFMGKLFNKGNRNNFVVIKDGKKVMSIPVTVLAILAVFTFWITIPILIIGLFFGYKYRFNGPELGKENVNKAMDSVSEAAENIKREFKGDNTHV